MTDGSSPGDWRLPTKAEWEATIARAVALGCILGSPGGPPSLTNDAGTSTGPSSFAGVASGDYWSSTANEDDPFDAWYAILDGGYLNFFVGRVGSLLVWPVRGGPR